MYIQKLTGQYFLPQNKVDKKLISLINKGE